MHHRAHRFALHVWLLLVVSLLVPLACSGSSRNVELPKPVASAASVAAVPPSPERCIQAADLRKKVKPFLDEGRLHRTVRLIEKADRLCPKSAPETWAALVTTLAELGKYAEARKVAAQIEADANASVEAKAAASSAKDTCDKLDKVFPAEGDAKEAMRRLHEEAMAAEEKTDSESQRLAKDKYLAAWEAWRPNGQALLSAGFVAKKLGQAAEAQRLFDRAILDGEKAQGSEVKLEVPNGFNGSVTAVAWSGRWFAVAHGEEISIFDAMTWRVKFRLPRHSGNTTSLAFAPDGQTLAVAVASRGPEVTLWDMATGMKKRTLAGGVYITAYSPDGKTLAVRASDGTVRLWEVATDKEPQALSINVEHFASVAYSPDGKTLALGLEDGTVLWDVASGQEVRTLKGDVKTYVASLAYSPDGKTLAVGSIDLASGPIGFASGSNDGTVQLWDVATGEKRRTLTEHAGMVQSLVYSPDGKTLASVPLSHPFARGEASVKLWDVKTGKPKRTFKEGSPFLGMATAVAYSPDSKTLALGDGDGVKLWDIATGAKIRTLGQPTSPLDSVAYSPDGRTLASGQGNTVNLWDATAGMDVRVLRGHAGSVLSVAFSPESKTLASGSSDKTVKLWDVATGSDTRTLTGHADIVSSVAYAPDGKALASGSGDKTVKLWDVTTGTQRRTLTGHADRVNSVAYSPDGKELASGSSDRMVKLWDVATGNEVETLIGHTLLVRSVAYSPDGKTLASGSEDNTVRLWDVATGEDLQNLTEHTDIAPSVAYSPDGKTLASGGSDGTVKLWDATTRNQLQTLTEHADGVSSVAYSSDGKTLALGGSDGWTRVYRVKDGLEWIALRALADKNAHYALTPTGHIDIRGPEACSARQYLVCRIGNLAFPFDACEERFLVPALYQKRMAGDTSYLEPENAPALMDCPAEP